jgi:hypothetical protein
MARITVFFFFFSRSRLNVIKHLFNYVEGTFCHGTKLLCLFNIIWCNKTYYSYLMNEVLYYHVYNKWIVIFLHHVSK